MLDRTKLDVKPISEEIEGSIIPNPDASKLNSNRFLLIKKRSLFTQLNDRLQKKQRRRLYLDRHN